jgi:UDP-glucuronate 4-epimerase
VPRRYLVTGGAGFIGSHVTEALLSRGDDVVVLDNFNDYYDPARKRSNLEEVRDVVADGGHLKVVEGDIRDVSVVASAIDQPVEAVIHLAAMAGVRASIENPGLYYDVNVMGTLRLLEAAVAAERKPVFVFASTSSVYGATDRMPLKEDDPCHLPLVPYSASKRGAELMGHAFNNLYGLDFTAVRFFTVYGPRGRPDMMAYKVAESARGGPPVPLYNGGNMQRDWTYVSDITSGVIAAADRRLGYEVVNLGRGEPVVLADFVRLVEAEAGAQAELTDAPMPQGDVARTHADITKAGKLLDYRPEVSVAEGVKRFVEWHRKAAK